MNVQHIRYFIAACQYKNISKAAEKINDPVALAALYDEFVKFYNLVSNTQLWTAQAEKFLTTICK